MPKKTKRDKKDKQTKSAEPPALLSPRALDTLVAADTSAADFIAQLTRVSVRCSATVYDDVMQ